MLFLNNSGWKVNRNGDDIDFVPLTTASSVGEPFMAI